MDYKEKYEQALEKAREIHSHLHGENKENYEKVFPELKESEDILSALKMEIKWLEVEAKWDNIGGISFDKVYAWLEKQGEEKVYSVWVGGSEINDYYLTEEEAKKLAREYKEDGYDNVIIEKQGEQKPAWSEDDEKYINDILAILGGGRGYRSNSQIEEWLKSLKPQSHWKPTEEQMKE